MHMFGVRRSISPGSPLGNLSSSTSAADERDPGATGRSGVELADQGAGVARAQPRLSTGTGCLSAGVGSAGSDTLRKRGGHGPTVTFARRLLIAIMALTVSLAIMALRPAPAHAQTVVSVINLPAVVIDNQCNGEPVALSGRLLTVVTTRSTPNGGTTVRSTSVTQGLQGTGLVSGVSYRAVERSGTVVNQLPPTPGTGTFFSTVTTLLLPRAARRRPGRLAAPSWVSSPARELRLHRQPALGSRPPWHQLWPSR